MIVKRIFREYLEGASLRQIGEGLMADGILTAAKKPIWRPEAIKKILQNEKYIGDALLQKTYTVDVLTKKRVKNNGIMPQYYVEYDHEAIIPRSVYTQVQEELIRRANLHSGKNMKKRVYSSNYALSSIVFCSKCGEIYRRVVWYNRDKSNVVWRCVTRIENGPSACDSQAIKETELQDAVVKAINYAIDDKEEIFEILQSNIESVLKEEQESSEEIINNKLQILQKELLQRVNSKKDYNDLTDEIDRLQKEKQQAQVDKAEREGMKNRIAEMRIFLDRQEKEINEYDEKLVRKMIEKVTVYDDKFTVEFKSGVSVDIERDFRENYIAP